MKDLIFVLGGDMRHLRHYTFGAVALCLITYLAVMGLAQVVGASGARSNTEAVASSTTRVYSVTRSVMDPLPTSFLHDVNTVRLDPCKKG